MPVALCLSITHIFKVSLSILLTAFPSSIFTSETTDFVISWCGITSRAVTLEPLASILKSSGVIHLTLTEFLTASASFSGSSAINFPFSAATTPFLITKSGLKVFKSGRISKSALYPGAIAPRFFSPKYSAVFKLAI